MAGTVLPNLGLHGDIPDHALWGTEGRANDRRLDSLVMPAIKAVLNDPPPSPLDGERYIVGPSPAGPWSGKAGYVTAWNAASGLWVFYAPKAGWSAYREDDRSIQRYVGAWFIDDLVVNVKRFGALGDGATDDTPAILAALAAVPANGRLHFPSGTYLLTGWAVQTLSKAVWITGDGQGNTVIKGTGGASFLSITARHRCSDITFDTWKNVLDFSAIASVVEQVLVENVEIKNYEKGIYGTGAVGGTGVRHFAVRACKLTTGTSYAIFLNLPIMEKVHVVDNDIKTCVQRGIDLGGNSLVFADLRGEYIITGNTVDGVSGGGSSSFGIIVYGWRATIAHNVVSNITRTSPTDTDCDGIYTKCRYSTIDHNILVDAGYAEGFINVKGGARGETVSQPYGFSVIVADNILVDTQIAPTLAGGGKQTNGIKIATSDVLVTGNHVEGLTEIGIYTDSDSGSDAPNHNITIFKNFIKDHRGKAGIAIYGRGNRVRSIDNLIDGILNSFAPGPQHFGIDIAKKEGSGTDIIGNRIHNLAAGSDPVGISINPGTTSKTVTADPGTDIFTTPSIHTFALNDPIKFTTTGTLPTDNATGLPLVAGTIYYVKAIPTTSTFTISATPGGALILINDAGSGTHTVWKVVTLTSWRVFDNHIEDARYGIQFTWNELYISLDDVFVRHTTGRNINGVTPPVLADLVKITDTPTNLLHLPARAETVERVSATVVEVANPGNLQSLRVFGTDDGAGNDHWIAIRGKATGVAIESGKTGTGVAQPLEVIVDGTAYWRFFTDGSLRPVTDETVDIGTSAIRARTIYAGGAGAEGIRLLPGDHTGGWLRIGTYRLWVDSTGDLRIKNGAPASDLDGTVVGTQT